MTNSLARRRELPESTRRIAKLCDDSRCNRIEESAIGHVGRRERQRDIEAVLVSPRNEVHVIVENVLASGSAAIHDEVHVSAASDVSNDRREAHADVE